MNGKIAQFEISLNHSYRIFLKLAVWLVLMFKTISQNLKKIHRTIFT